MVDMNVMEQFVQSLKQDTETATTTYSATVSNIDNEGVVWVYLSGADRETPTALSSSEINVGDHVTVEWRNDKLYIAGNYSNPSAGMQRVVVIEKVADDADQKATSAKQTADDASETAGVASATANQAQYTADSASNNITILSFDLETAINGGYSVSGETTIEDSGLDVSTRDFHDAVEGVFGDYEFVYDGSDWSLDSETVSLADYGITLASGVEVQEGDTITIALLEVEGFKNALNSQYTELTEIIDNTATEAEENLTSATEDINEKIEENSLAIESAQTSIEDLNNKTSRIGFSTEYGFIIFGQDATETEKFKLQLTSSEINFIDGALGNDADINAQITNNMLNINVANITSRLIFGNFAFIPRANGNMCLKYMG